MPKRDRSRRRLLGTKSCAGEIDEAPLSERIYTSALGW